MNRHKLSLLLAIATTLATSLPASAQMSSGEINLIGIGASLLNNLINPPHREAEIKAETEIRKAKIAAEAEITKEKMRIAADSVTPLLNQWGVNRISCAPGMVFINGIDSNTVCVQPNAAMTAGYYTYNNTKSQLFRTSGTMSQTTQTTLTTLGVTTTGNSNRNGF